jgi:tRNA pseudouridine55 synthase
MRYRQCYMEGFLLIDKPAGITSFAVVAQLRRVTGVQRIGHAGTLDPFLGMDKTYEATAVLGASSDTQDKDGVIVPTLGTDGKSARLPTAEEIAAILPRFTGAITQTPPMFSAKKIDGKKMYELAREGVTVERQPVALTIHSLETLKYEPPRWSFRVTGSSGTYVRTLAHDIGAALGCGAYLEALRRTKIGNTAIDDAKTLAEVTPENWTGLLRPL